MKGNPVLCANGGRRWGLSLFAHPGQGLLAGQLVFVKGLSVGPLGEFVFDKLLPGKYRLLVDCHGYMEAYYGSHGPNLPGAEVEIGSGTAVKDLRFLLTPYGSLSGRIMNDDGAPTSNYRIEVLRCYCFGTSRRGAKISIRGFAEKGDAFRLGSVPPGNYLVRIVRKAKSPQVEVDGVYYPGTRDPSKALAVAVGAGRETGNIELRLPPVPTATLRGTFVIRGSVIHPETPPPAPAPPRRQPPLPVRPNPPIPRPGITGNSGPTGASRPSAPTELGESARLTLMTKDGRALAVTDEVGHGFEFRNVPPGEYTVFTRAIVRPSPLPFVVYDPPRIIPTVISGQRAVTLVDKDLDGIAVELRRGVEVSGKITGITPPPTIHNGLFSIGATLFLSPRDGASLPVPRDQDSLIFKGFPVEFSGRILNAWSPQTRTLDPTADFRVSGVPPGKYTVQISWPTGASYDRDSDLATWLRKYYVQSITVAGEEVERNIIDVPPGGLSNMEVHMAITQAPPNTISVIVRDDSGAPVPHSMVTVTPVSHDDSCSTSSVTADQNGQASIGVAPCDYYIQAWEYPTLRDGPFDPDTSFDPYEIGPSVDAQFREHFRSSATLVSLKEVTQLPPVSRGGPLPVQPPSPISLGQTVAEVESILGRPRTIIGTLLNVGDKKIYVYRELEITFVGGKVSDVRNPTPKIENSQPEVDMRLIPYPIIEAESAKPFRRE